jgi:argininosuccinate lyase
VQWLRARERTTRERRVTARYAPKCALGFARAQERKEPLPAGGFAWFCAMSFGPGLMIQGQIDPPRRKGFIAAMTTTTTDGANLYGRIALAMSTWLLVLAATNLSAQPRDEFYWLAEINKASAVMLVEQGIVPKVVAARIADAVTAVTSAASRPGAARPGDYLEVERLLIAVGGPEVTRVHSGRSRQDIKGTVRRLFMREALLGAFERLADARQSLLTAAEAHRDAIVPAYTYGVQAQPTSFGHYMGAYAEALRRTADRYRESWRRVNQSSLGSAALGTSSFPVNRPRLAALLGFDGSITNSLDANQIAPLDTGVEVVSIATASALTIGMLAADITAQYSHVKPWLTFAGGEVTGTSSIMPQKRNPTGLVELRQEASTIVGTAMTYTVQSHNVMQGMEDYKMDTPSQVLNASGRLCGALVGLLKAVVFDEARALDEVNADYSTTTELADTLQRVADVPFRVGHHFASELVNYGRGHQLRPAEIPYREAQRIYRESARVFQQSAVELPLGEADFRRSLTPENMVQSAQGLGGPQAAEVARMLTDERARLAADREWLAGQRGQLEQSDVLRGAAFDALKASK